MNIPMRHRWVMFVPLLLLLALPATRARAAEIIPPSPSPYFIVDEGHVLSPSVLASVDRQLQQVERDTSDQIVVAIYPKMQSSDDIAAYAVRVFQAWQIGKKANNNGVLLLVFTEDHKLNITTGYGLEGALPDATCKQIIENDIKPHFKAGDYDSGIQAGVTAILAATRGEYRGTGHTILDYSACLSSAFIGLLALLLFAGIITAIFGTTYSSSGRVPAWVIPFILLSNIMSSRSGGSGGSSGGGGGGWSGGGGGGFSGGGGSTGGGGASGSW